MWCILIPIACLLLSLSLYLSEILTSFFALLLFDIGLTIILFVLAGLIADCKDAIIKIQKQESKEQNNKKQSDA